MKNNAILGAVIGFAAGTAAALSVKQEKRLRDIDVKEIQKVVGE